MITSTVCTSILVSSDGKEGDIRRTTSGVSSHKRLVDVRVSSKKNFEHPNSPIFLACKLGEAQFRSMRLSISQQTLMLHGNFTLPFMMQQPTTYTKPSMDDFPYIKCDIKKKNIMVSYMYRVILITSSITPSPNYNIGGIHRTLKG